MALALFSKRPAASTVTPARAAFNTARGEYLAKSKERLALLDKMSELQRHTKAADEAAARVAALQADCDAGVAASLLDGEPAPDLEDRKRALAAAENLAAELAPIARAADVAHRRMSVEAAELTRQEQALYAPIRRLAHPILFDDDLAALAAEFREKEEAFRAIHRRVFVVARAADKMAQSEALGVFRSSAEYEFLHITRPAHDAYWRGSRDSWTATQEERADHMALDLEADQLIHNLLTSEPV